MQPSVIVQQGLLPLAFFIYGFIYFVLLGCIFVFIQERLQKTKLIKGFIYGLFFCILTFLLYLEPLPSTTTFSFTNLVWMLVDGGQFLILGILLGWVLATNTKLDENMEKSSNKLLILVIPIIFLLGRLISYNVFRVYSNFQTLPLNTTIWVLGVGLGIGILYYYILRPAIKTDSPLHTSLRFGIIFGVYLFMLNFAYALIVSFILQTYLDFIIRNSMDVIFAIIAIFTYEYLVKEGE
ncbi:hypothetical protein GCM10025861_25570 [Methanobacterium petrolearium]|nr:hypothetical protein GCM10025861_25570 [Methanobacterium petrolearium]